MSTATLELRASILAEAAERAERLRRRLADRGTFAVRLLSSPGSGKTALLEATARRLAPSFRLAALVGDIATDRDAQRLSPFMPTVQLTTGGACHLELPLVESGLDCLGEIEPPQFLFVEDVGNLVCPASFDLGEHLRVVLLSVTEGDDKPRKYPKAFRTADVALISKIDLLPHVPFSPSAARADAWAVRPDLEVLEASALCGTGIEAWCAFLINARRRRIEVTWLARADDH